MHTKIIDVHLVIHLLCPDGQNLDYFGLGRVWSLDSKFCRNIDGFHQLLRTDYRWVIQNFGFVFAHKRTDTIYTLDFLKFCLESH